MEVQSGFERRMHNVNHIVNYGASQMRVPQSTARSND